MMRHAIAMEMRRRAPACAWIDGPSSIHNEARVFMFTRPHRRWTPDQARLSGHGATGSMQLGMGTSMWQSALLRTCAARDRFVYPKFSE